MNCSFYLQLIYLLALLIFFWPYRSFSFINSNTLIFLWLLDFEFYLKRPLFSDHMKFIFSSTTIMVLPFTLFQLLMFSMRYGWCWVYLSKTIVSLPILSILLHIFNINIVQLNEIYILTLNFPITELICCLWLFFKWFSEGCGCKMSSSVNTNSF